MQGRLEVIVNPSTYMGSFRKSGPFQVPVFIRVPYYIGDLERDSTHIQKTTECKAWLRRRVMNSRRWAGLGKGMV